MARLIKRTVILICILAFAAVVVANRTGKFAVKPFAHGGTEELVTESTRWSPDVSIVKVGVFVDNVYDFNHSTQSVASEGNVWLTWGEKFQQLLDQEGISVEQALYPVNRVNSWDWLLKPYYMKPIRLPSGEYYQLIRFAGRFYVDDLDLHRFPFERVSFPISFGLNAMGDVFGSENVRLIADTKQSGVGPFIDIIGYSTESFQVQEYIQTYPTGFGFTDPGSSARSSFSQVRLEISYRKAGAASVSQLILPLLVVMLIVLVSPSIGASHWDVRIAIPSTALLTLVFLQQTYRQNLPLLPYVTYLDQIYGVCYIVTFSLFCLFLWGSNKLETTPEADKPGMVDYLNKIDSRCQILFVLVIVLTCIINWFKPLQY